ncbi:hypothetical protein [Candidatus Solirubrobacter pratensis]|uniref:hypothetical protein n=1 Tax=Candidatus Solirubrobacter pratensis TaxID=1298857 RepID=UPI00048505F9|nr:hypothetical protein [Candidatus Solirubrobacter pratensis]
MTGVAKYVIMIPRVPHAPSLAQDAQHALVNGDQPLHHAFLDPGKWAHWPGEEPQLHDLVVAYADETPVMDSHVKQLARTIGKHGNLAAVFALKEGNGRVTPWKIHNT